MSRSKSIIILARAPGRFIEEFQGLEPAKQVRMLDMIIRTESALRDPLQAGKHRLSGYKSLGNVSNFGQVREPNGTGGTMRSLVTWTSRGLVYLGTFNKTDDNAIPEINFAEAAEKLPVDDLDEFREATMPVRLVRHGRKRPSISVVPWDSFDLASLQVYITDQVAEKVEPEEEAVAKPKRERIAFARNEPETYAAVERPTVGRVVAQAAEREWSPEVQKVIDGPYRQFERLRKRVNVLRNEQEVDRARIEKAKKVGKTHQIPIVVRRYQNKVAECHQAREGLFSAGNLLAQEIRQLQLPALEAGFGFGTLRRPIRSDRARRLFESKQLSSLVRAFHVHVQLEIPFDGPLLGKGEAVSAALRKEAGVLGRWQNDAGIPPGTGMVGELQAAAGRPLVGPVSPTDASPVVDF